MRRLTLDERKKFLEDDLSDALKGPFVGAVVWAAADASERCPFQKGLGMFTSLVQARALYEFYSPKLAEDDDAPVTLLPMGLELGLPVFARSTWAGESQPINAYSISSMIGVSTQAD